jgi:hypothetical protein
VLAVPGLPLFPFVLLLFEVGVLERRVIGGAVGSEYRNEEFVVGVLYICLGDAVALFALEGSRK